MYCSHCGKKVGDAMLFCPFCGDPIVIPEQDEAGGTSTTPPPIGEAAKPERKSGDDASGAVSQPSLIDAGDAPSGVEGDAAAELADWSRSRRSLSDEWARRDEPLESFTPLELDQPGQEPEGDWMGEISRRKEAAQPERRPPEMRKGEDEPVRLDGAAPKLELEVEGAKPAGDRKASRKHANTLVPPKPMNPDDMFMDSNASEDDYDAYDDDGASPPFAEGFVYEDDDEGSFFMRHVRGIVGLALFVIMLLMFVIFAFSKAGQLTLAKANLAWSTDAYSQLGYQSYQAGQYAQAGQYYSRALQRDQGNYSYASSAAMAYYEAGDVDRAVEMLKKCVEINPALLEPYVYLLKLYPDAAQRPWDITQLLQQGYQQTGDSRLNVTG